jgi:hypothetical protein
MLFIFSFAEFPKFSLLCSNYAKLCPIMQTKLLVMAKVMRAYSAWPYDVVVFDCGHPEENEAGGRVYEVFDATGRSAGAYTRPLFSST